MMIEVVINKFHISSHHDLNRGEDFQERPPCQLGQKDGWFWDSWALLSCHCSRPKVMLNYMVIWIILLYCPGTSSPLSQILKMEKEHAVSSLKSWRLRFHLMLRRLWFQLLPLRTMKLKKKPGKKWPRGERWSVSRRWWIWWEMN